MPTRGTFTSVAAVALTSLVSLALASCGGSPTTGAGSGGNGDAYAEYAAMELATPKWKGRISLEMSDWDWYLAWHTYLTEKGMTAQQADALFRGLAGNAKVVKGHTVQGELLSSGQFAVALSAYSHTVDKAARKKAPVAWRPPVQPVLLRPNGLGLMGRPKHPAAATLWMDWVLTGGQSVIAAATRIPAARSVPGYTSPVPAGTQTYDVPLEKLRTAAKKWETAYDQLVRGAQKTGG